MHLIGHSHGGNLINQFTELISKDNKFPKLWKVKSITYLSTPFFREKHQLNHTKLHKDCKIINVHNDYDLTQQLIASFSLPNLEYLMKSFKSDKFKEDTLILKNINKDIVVTYLKGLSWFSSDHIKRGIPAWKEMSKAFLGIHLIAWEFYRYIDSLKISNTKLHKEKKDFMILLKKLIRWTYRVHHNYISGKSEDYYKSEWL